MCPNVWFRGGGANFDGLLTNTSQQILPNVPLTMLYLFLSNHVVSLLPTWSSKSFFFGRIIILHKL